MSFVDTDLYAFALGMRLNSEQDSESQAHAIESSGFQNKWKTVNYRDTASHRPKIIVTPESIGKGLLKFHEALSGQIGFGFSACRAKKNEGELGDASFSHLKTMERTEEEKEEYNHLMSEALNAFSEMARDREVDDSLFLRTVLGFN